MLQTLEVRLCELFKTLGPPSINLGVLLVYAMILGAIFLGSQGSHSGLHVENCAFFLFRLTFPYKPQ